MKTYYIAKYNQKRLEIVVAIIKNEDLDATYLVENDALGNLMIAVTCDEEDYETLKQVYEMIVG